MLPLCSKGSHTAVCAASSVWREASSDNSDRVRSSSISADWRPGVQRKSEMKSFLIFIALFCSNSSITEIQDIHIKNLIVPLHPKVGQTTVKIYNYKLIFSGWWECGTDLWLRACRGGGLQCQMVQRGSGDIQVMLKFDIFQITMAWKS